MGALSVSPGLWATPLTIGYDTDFELAGPIDGSRVGSIWDGTGPKAFEPRLGSLVQQQVGIDMRLLYTATVGPVPTGGTVYTQGFDITYRLQEFGMQPLQIRYQGPSICRDERGCIGTTFPRYTLISGGLGDSTTAGGGLGGPIGISVVGTVTPGLTGATGDWILNGRAQVRQDYEPRTLSEYVVDAARRAAGGTDAERAYLGYNDVISLRGFDAVTSSQNLALRDAEYFLRGYYGGAESVGTFWADSLAGGADELASKAGPVASTVYLAMKAIAQAMGRNVAGDGELPASPVGGWDANFVGYLAGWYGVPLESAAYLGPAIYGAIEASTDPAHASLPQASIQDIDGELDLFNLLAGQAGTTYFVDPRVAEVIAYGVVGNAFTGFTLPIDAPVDHVLVEFLDQRRLLHRGESVDFTDFAEDGVARFALTGLPMREPGGPAFVAGLSFAASGPLLLAVAATDRSAVVPEPSVLMLLLPALLLA